MADGAPRISLTVRRRDEGGTAFSYSFAQEEVLVGRGESVDVRLPHASVSLVHLRLIRRKGQLFALDDGSTNGSRLDGEPLTPGQPAMLRDGGRLEVGPFELVLGAVAEPLTSPDDTAAFARRMVLELLGESQTSFLEVEEGPDRGQRLPLARGCAPLVIGRQEGCALRLSDADVSRQHLEVRGQGEALVARDLGSKNGLIVDGRAVEGSHVLRHGDRLRVGQTTLLFQWPAERYLAELGRPQLESPAPSPKPEAAQAEVASSSPSRPPPLDDPERGRGSYVALVVVGAVLIAAGLAAVLYLLL
jgi:pSer/pThr/pTyr-binding forkhead associated (FHA) protein